MKTHFSKRTLTAAFCAVMALTACTSPATRLNPDFQPINFVSDPIPLALNNITLSREPRAPTNATPVDADFVVPLEDIVSFWPKQRLRATGGSYTGQYIIDAADAVSRRNPDGGEVIFGTMQARLVLLNPDGSEQGFVGTRVDSELRITGEPSIIERQEFLHDMAVKMADQFDEKMTASVVRQLGSLIDQNVVVELERREAEIAREEQLSGAGGVIGNLRTQVREVGKAVFITQE